MMASSILETPGVCTSTARFDFTACRGGGDGKSSSSVHRRRLPTSPWSTRWTGTCPRRGRRASTRTAELPTSFPTGTPSTRLLRPCTARGVTPGSWPRRRRHPGRHTQTPIRPSFPVKLLAEAARREAGRHAFEAPRGRWPGVGPVAGRPVDPLLLAPGNEDDRSDRPGVLLPALGSPSGPRPGAPGVRGRHDTASAARAPGPSLTRTPTSASARTVRCVERGGDR